MAKGWESKNVEEQLAGRDDAKAAAHAPAVAASRLQGDTMRQRQSLELQRESILNERTSNAHRRASLAAALAHVEQQLAALNQD